MRWLGTRKTAAFISGAVFGWLVGVAALPHPPLSRRAPLSRAVYAADGTLMRLTLASDGQYRLWTPLANISPALVQATLLYEDKHFRRHLGINPWALVRATATSLFGHRRMGGSTLTMQLARRLWNIDSRGPLGKLWQMATALHLELAYSKDELLEAYLNLVPYGGNIEGVGAAARVYFAKAPQGLQVTDAVTLAVIPQSPGARGTPVARGHTIPPALTQARTRLWALWQKQHSTHPSDAVVLSQPPQMKSLRQLPFLAAHLTEEALAKSKADVVTTTLHPRLQRVAEREVSRFIATQRELGIHNATVLIAHHASSEIVALVGSADYFSNAIAGAVDGTAARRSPGSTLKPFVYALAMDQGLIHPQTLVRDSPTRFSDYVPENFDGEFAGPVSATDALVRSRNIPAVALAAKLTSPTLFGLLRQAGVGDLVDEAHYGLGIALGAAELTMRELTALYASLAQAGNHRPLTIFKAPTPQPTISLLSPQASYLTLTMLAQTPRPDALDPVGVMNERPAIPWKTGTSWGFRDAWSVGIVGPYVLAVWVGDFASRSNPAYVGRKAAAPLFFAIADAMFASGLAKPWMPSPPPGVSRVPVCALTGALPGPDCPATHKGWFIPGRSPITRCEVHRALTIDDKTNQRVCQAVPGHTTHKAVYEVWPSDLAALFVAAGLPRQSLPPPGPGCRALEENTGQPPRLTSPSANAAFALTGAPSSWKPVPLRAEIDGDAAEVFYFVDGSFAGRAKGGVPVFWAPRPGKFLVRAIDDRGRDSAIQMVVQVVQ